ncbi:putative lipoprotein YiaD [Nitrospira tepida]|uniref:Lipoprotein YiaD n=2 Tax=Nitrospira tepida TaxID=2973512 RepID=A0AA86T302_9BACT|nr:putative lipoprotein YiaD [Nitrospira tepida]
MRFARDPLSQHSSSSGLVMTRTKVVALGLAALFMLAFLCAQRTAMTSTAGTTRGAEASKLSLSVEDGKIVLRGAVPDSVKQLLVAKAYQAFGAGYVANHLTVVPGATAEDWSLKAAESIQKLNSWGSGGLSFDGRHVIVKGEAKNEAEKAKRTEELAGVFGALLKVENQMELPAQAAQPKASPAVAKIHEALAGKTIEFEVSSATLTPRGMKVLDELVPIIQSDKDLKLEIGGHTDNYGDPKFNQLISHARAVAVAQYLASKGVDGRRLVSKGYGESKPIASNKTKDGRKQNRRVTFEAL